MILKYQNREVTHAVELLISKVEELIVDYLENTKEMLSNF